MRTGRRRLLCPAVASPALDGILVADLSRVLAGPLCTMSLGDLGADVIKVERPDGGDDTRAWGPPFVRRGLDLLPGPQPQQALGRARPQGARPTWRSRASCACAPTSSSSPSGRAPATAWASATTRSRTANPGVVYCSISAFGSGERAAALPGYDLLLQAMSGLMSVTGRARRSPAEGRRGAHRHDLRPLRHQRHPGRPARARPRRPTASTSRSRSWTRALAEPAQPGLGPPQRRRGARAHGQPPPLDRPLRDVRGGRRRLRGGRRQRHDLRPPVRGRRSPRAGR